MAQKKKPVATANVVALSNEAEVAEPVDSGSAIVSVVALDGDNWQTIAKRYLPEGKVRNTYAAELWILNGRKDVVPGMSVKLD